MKLNSYVLCAILLLYNIQLVVNTPCKRREAKLKSIIRGKYKNVLNYNMGTLISSKQQNGFSVGIYGSCLRDNIYTITGGYGFTSSVLGKSIIFDLQEQYELNTLKIWFWDQSYRFYRIKIYLIYKDVETIIYESNFVQSITTVTFPVQAVQRFKALLFFLFNPKYYNQLYTILMEILKILCYIQQKRKLIISYKKICETNLILYMNQ